MSGYRNDGEFSIGRHLRDMLSSPIMINNDRILANVAAAALLTALPGSLGTRASPKNGHYRCAKNERGTHEADSAGPVLESMADALLLPTGINGVYARTAIFENTVEAS